MSAFRILTADDHPIFRFGLASLLRSHEGWEICGEASNGRDAVEKCRQLKPDLLILDISKEVAAILHMALATTETHRSNILRKLRLHSIAEVVLYAVRNGIVHVQPPM